jgi:hypothetical protein
MKRVFCVLLLSLVLSSAVQAQELFSNHYFSHRVFVELAYDRIIAIDYDIDSSMRKMVESEMYMFSISPRPKGFDNITNFVKMDMASITRDWRNDQALKTLSDTVVGGRDPNVRRRINSDHQIVWEVSAGHRDKSGEWHDSTVFHYNESGLMDQAVSYNSPAFHTALPAFRAHEADYVYDSLGRLVGQTDRDYHRGDSLAPTQKKSVFSYNKEGLPDYIQHLQYIAPDTWLLRRRVIVRYERNKMK